MRDSDRFDWRRPQDYVWLMLGMVYFIMLPFIWIAQLMGSVDTSTSSRRTRSPRRLIQNTVRTTPRRFRMPRARVIKTPRIKKIKPTWSVSRRWVKSLGRYQTTYYNRETRRRYTTPKVSEMVPKK